MGRFSGKIGFSKTEETSPGIWSEKIIEKHYIGDTLRQYKNTVNNDSINSGINIQNRISIVADAFINENLYAIRYVEYMGSKWYVTSVEVEHPRLILYLGGVYTDGQQD